MMIKFSNTNTVLTSDIVFTCTSQSREVMSGVSEACMQVSFKRGLSLQPRHMTATNASVFCPFPLSFHPLQGGFQSEAREPSGGTLRRLQGVQSKKGIPCEVTLTDCLTVMFYGWWEWGGAHSFIKRGGQWSTQVSPEKSYRTAVAQKKLTSPCWPPSHVGSEFLY